ncbi:Arm DNA-binding domain-containing protein [Bacillus cereus]
MDIGPHPETGERRQRWFSGYKTKKEVQTDLAKKNRRNRRRLIYRAYKNVST